MVLASFIFQYKATLQLQIIILISYEHVISFINPDCLFKQRRGIWNIAIDEKGVQIVTMDSMPFSCVKI
jgi:hypothetical protein